MIDEVAVLVEAQELGEREVEAGGDSRRDGERRARLAALDLAQHRGADAASLGEVAQREAHRLAQGADAGARRRDGRALGDCGWHAAYSIT